jgi:hypothetical protein
MPANVGTIVAKVALVGQTSSIGATTLFTPVADGTFRLSAYMSATGDTVASSSFLYTDPDDPSSLAAQGPSGSLATPGNNTDVIRVKGGTNIQYQANKLAGTTGSFNFHVVLESLQA